MTPKQVVEESKKIMTGQRSTYFLLELSFIGWILLSFITFGLGMIFLNPYMQIATIVFYEDRLKNSKVQK